MQTYLFLLMNFFVAHKDFGHFYGSFGFCLQNIALLKCGYRIKLRCCTRRKQNSSKMKVLLIGIYLKLNSQGTITYKRRAPSG